MITSTPRSHQSVNSSHNGVTHNGSNSSRSNHHHSPNHAHHSPNHNRTNHHTSSNGTTPQRPIQGKTLNGASPFQNGRASSVFDKTNDTNDSTDCNGNDVPVHKNYMNYLSNTSSSPEDGDDSDEVVLADPLGLHLQKQQHNDDSRTMMRISCRDYKQLVGDLALLQCQLKSREKSSRLQRVQIDELRTTNLELEQTAKQFNNTRTRLDEDLGIERNRMKVS